MSSMFILFIWSVVLFRLLFFLYSYLKIIGVLLAAELKIGVLLAAELTIGVLLTAELKIGVLLAV